MDHFFRGEISLDDFSKSTYKEAGDFLGAPYKARAVAAKGLEGFCFEKKGAVHLKGRPRPLSLTKTVSPAGDSGLRAHYSLTNSGSTDLRFVFGVELNLSIGETFAMKGLSEKNVREWVFNDSWRGIAIKLGSDLEASLLAAPVETVSESESGLERTYQELAVLLQRAFHLKPKETKQQVLELSVSV